jgi:hypothetical protein
MKYLILLLISTSVTLNVAFNPTDVRTITGTVMDETNETLVFCNIYAYDKDNKLLNDTVTNLDGKFTFTVPTSCHWIEAVYTGFPTRRIEVNEASDYIIVMNAGAVLSDVVIKGFAPKVTLDKAMSGEASMIRNLPTKNINAIAATTAGLSSIDGGAISIRGSRSTATDYYVDGIRVSSTAPVTSGTISSATPEISATPEVSTSGTGHPSKMDYAYRPGQLTAGEINDFGKWILWNDKSQQEITDYRKVWNMYPLKRYSVILQNTDRIPMIGQTVQLLDNNNNIVWTAKTDNTGKAELWSNMFDDTSKDGQTFSINTKINDKEYNIEHAKCFEKGLNHLTIKSECNLSNVVDVVFAVDATSSMGDEITYLKEELTDVLQKIKDSHQDLTLNLGSVFYRDHGDEYIVRTSELSSDISKTITFIQNQTANGGGDGPEAIDEALEVAISHMNWSSNARAKLLFVVMDAPPHQTAENLKRIRQVAFDAAKEGIKIIPLTASGIDKSTEYLMRSLALCTNGTYVFLTDHSGIGNPHLEPTTDTYDVEKLNDLLIRLFDQNTSAVSCSKGMEHNLQVMSDTLEIQASPVLLKDTLQDFSIAGKEIEQQKIQFKYYPNPTTGLINIDVKGNIQELFLCDFSGKLLQRFEVNGASHLQVDISRYPIGIYRLMYFESINEPRSGTVVFAQ